MTGRREIEEDPDRSTALKTLAVMQPYVFPYVGYFSLLRESDVFVYYDDVSFIKQGWINRNRVLVNGAAHIFSIPLQNGSSNELICNVRVSKSDFFRKKFLKTLQQAYARAPNFDVGIAYVEAVLSSNPGTISELAVTSIEEGLALLGMQVATHRSSMEFGYTRECERSDRLIRIAGEVGCNRYVNAIGGVELYDKEYFAARGIRLEFLKPTLMAYEQGVPEPVLGLSIIDLLMHLDVDEIRNHVASYEIL